MRVGFCNIRLPCWCKNTYQVCLVYAKHNIVVWNPCTGTYRQLPDISLSRRKCTYSFGYDSAYDDYKVLLVTLPVRRGDGGRLDIFSLKTGSWKKVEDLDDTYLKYIQPLQCGLFLNGALHWETWHNGCIEGGKIFAFDLSMEKFYDVAKSAPGFGRYGHCSLGVVGEYLCIFVFSCGLGELRKYAVWVMKEYCNEASWVQFITYCSFNNDIAASYVEYVRNFVPQSVKDGGYMILQYPEENVDVLMWNNNLDESDNRGEEYFKNIQYYGRVGDTTPYTEALSSPYACMEEIDRGV
ncbi:hypothetical protein Tsubulata_046987 [Turnera subulata]|uniref:F-box associated beta-propeller type 1 domain-containing protein n=1 Tax=Turnera subulata TaxID=218843 RepID=A0A9Q0G7F1_9ROSI|nr:hypothetical protein Tsubulata_046987 [Turnera subulata]